VLTLPHVNARAPFQVVLVFQHEGYSAIFTKIFNENEPVPIGLGAIQETIARVYDDLQTHDGIAEVHLHNDAGSIMVVRDSEERGEEFLAEILQQASIVHLSKAGASH
jgi:hypothetical protein